MLGYESTYLPFTFYDTSFGNICYSLVVDRLKVKICKYIYMLKHNKKTVSLLLCNSFVHYLTYF